MNHEMPELVSYRLDVHGRKLEEMLDRIELSVDVGSWSEARRRFWLFREEFDRQIRLEEDLLFPSVEALEGHLCTAEFRVAHRDLGWRLDQIEALLADERPIDEAIARFADLFEAHKLEEEMLAYPAFERMASPSTRAATLAELDSFARDGAAIH